MIRRYPPRPTRGSYQDFHFFAAGDPIANLESRLHAPAVPAPAVPASASATPATPAAATPPSSPAPPAQPGPPYTIDILVPPQSIPALERQLGLRPSDGDDDADHHADSRESHPALERAMEALEKIDAAAALPPSEPPAIDEIEAMEPKDNGNRARTRKKPSPKSRVRAGARTRLAVPRQASSANTRQRLASEALANHEAQCTICSHPCRAEIENEFMHWHAIGHIAYDYKLSRSAIYRHAYALNLFSQRNRRLRFALGHLIERVQDVQPTADSIIRAVHLFARINDQGECIEPPAHVIVSSGSVRREAPAPSVRRPIAISLDSPALAAPASLDGPAPNCNGEAEPPAAPSASLEPASMPGVPDAPRALGHHSPPVTSRCSNAPNPQTASRFEVRKGGTVNRPHDHATS